MDIYNYIYDSWKTTEYGKDCRDEPKRFGVKMSSLLTTVFIFWNFWVYYANGIYDVFELVHIEYNVCPHMLRMILSMRIWRSYQTFSWPLSILFWKLQEVQRYLMTGKLISCITDPRTTDWFLVRHEWTVFVMFGAYLYFVLQCGPKYMENRRPYDLKTFIKFYNIFQIIYNAWIVYACIKNGLFRDFGLGCEFVDRSETGRPMEVSILIRYVIQKSNKNPYNYK